MRQWCALGLIGMSLLTVERGAAQGKFAGVKGWQFSLDTAKTLAKKTGKPMMVVFRCEP